MLEAVVKGWRIRRIMKLRDTKGRAELVREHSNWEIGEIVGNGIIG